MTFVNEIDPDLSSTSHQALVSYYTQTSLHELDSNYMGRESRLANRRWEGEGIGFVSALLVQSFRPINHNLVFFSLSLSLTPLPLVLLLTLVAS